MKKEFKTITGEELLALNFPPMEFVVENLIPKGLHILAGSPKIGKSWLSMWLALMVAKGENVWGNSVTQGTTLYLCFEDPNVRVQSRLMELTEDAPNNVHFCTEVSTFQTGLLEQIKNFKVEHPSTNLVIVDTLQIVKGTSSDSTYASDYADLVPLKELAYELNVAIILIHHLKKKAEADIFHQISGTTGLQGVVDGMYILAQKRNLEGNCNSSATLHCVGRDFGQREIELKKNSENVWAKISDSLDGELSHLAKLKVVVCEFMNTQNHFLGTATELSALLESKSDDKFSARTLSKNLLLCQKELENYGILFENRRSNGKRWIELKSISVASVDSVDEIPTCVGEDFKALSTLKNESKEVGYLC